MHNWKQLIVHWLYSPVVWLTMHSVSKAIPIDKIIWTFWNWPVHAWLKIDFCRTPSNIWNGLITCSLKHLKHFNHRSQRTCVHIEWKSRCSKKLTTLNSYVSSYTPVGKTLFTIYCKTLKHDTRHFRSHLDSVLLLGIIIKLLYTTIRIL